MTHPTPQGNEETVEARARPGDKGALFRLKAVAAGGDVTDVYGAEWCHEAPGAALRLDLATALAPPIREHGEGVRERLHEALEDDMGHLTDAQSLSGPYALRRVKETIDRALSAQPVKDAVQITPEIDKALRAAMRRSHTLVEVLPSPASVGLDPETALWAALPEKIGRLSLGEKLSQEHYCGGSHDMPDGQPIYWQERGGEYPDDIDGYCLTCAIEQAESDSGWCECSIKAALTPEDRP